MVSEDTHVDQGQVRARFEIVDARLERELSLDDRELVSKRIARSIELAEKVRQVPMSNADEPANVFFAEAIAGETL